LLNPRAFFLGDERIGWLQQGVAQADANGAVAPQPASSHDPRCRVNAGGADVFDDSG
jgi:hypothetical protein